MPGRARRGPDAARRARALVGNALSGEQHQEAEPRYHVCHAQREQAQAEKHAREAKGTLEAEELARRERELADVRATLTVLEAGTRSEEVEAERRLARLREEERYLEQRTSCRFSAPCRGWSPPRG